MGESVYVGTGTQLQEIQVPDNLVIKDVAGLPSAGDSFAASVEVDGAPADIWVYNSVVSRWSPLISGPEAYEDIDWRP